ncbi:MAG: SpoIID/LytB domain-containing protein, partial [Sporomusaceae bacterium]|nr:SpoIID/LytB domain-containing protein [Sporomusaceae bacterium]
HNGELITAYYHSSGGGYTENSENVWVTSVPYLRGVVDFDQDSPRYKWEKRFSVAEFSEKLKNTGTDIGVLKSIELSKLTKQPVKAADRGVSGRVKTAKLTGTKGSGSFEGSKLRSVLGLDSTLFEMKLVLVKDEQYVVITGFGLGHGVGMSQWGAKAMAEKAKTKDYYQEILRHYYKDTKIEKVY